MSGRDSRHPGDEDLLTLHWDGGRRTAAHVAACAACSARLEELRAALRSAEASPVPERGDSYGRELWARLEPRLPGRPGGLGLAALFAPRALGLAAAFAAVVVAAFLAGRLAGRGTAPPAAAADASKRLLLSDLASHLDRSEAVLLELANGRGASKNGTDVSAEQARLADLLPANRLYRQTAKREGDAAVSGLLDEIERVLLEVEHGPSELSAAERDSLAQRIESEGILFRLRILSARVRQLERSAPPKPTIERKRA